MPDQDQANAQATAPEANPAPMPETKPIEEAQPATTPETTTEPPLGGAVGSQEPEGAAPVDAPVTDQSGNPNQRALPSFMQAYYPAPLQALKIASVTVAGDPPSEPGAVTPFDPTAPNALVPPNSPSHKVTLTFEDDGHTRGPFEFSVGENMVEPREGDYLVLAAGGRLIVWPADMFELAYAKA